MDNSDFKTWALVLILALGGLWQISKSLGGSTVSKQSRDWDAVNALDHDDQPYSVDSAPRAKSAQGKVHVEGATASVGNEQLAKFLATAATSGEISDKAAVKKEDKCEPKKDPVTGATIPCEFKKKKKKKKAAVAEEIVNDLPKTASKPIDADSKGIEWNVGAAIQTGRVNAVNTKPDQAFESLEAWEARLLTTPDLAETKVFIDHYQRNLVSTEIFYKIAQEMLDDSRSDMKLLGVMCAGVTSSVSSFQMLAQFIAKTPTGNAPRTQADSALSRYSDLNSLTILASVLRGNSIEAATIAAAQKLDIAAKRYLVSTTPATTTPVATDPTAPAATPAASPAVKNRSSFTRFVSILTTLSKSGDAQVKDQASRSLANLNSLLGTTVAAPTAPTTPNTTT